MRGLSGSRGWSAGSRCQSEDPPVLMKRMDKSGGCHDPAHRSGRHSIFGVEVVDSGPDAQPVGKI